MTSGDAGVPGSYNWSDTSQLVADQQPQQPRPRPPPQDPSNVSTMSVTTVYHPPTYCPPPQFAHNQSNPPPHVYRRPSHPGVPIYSNQATPSTPNPPVLGPHQGQENSQRKNVTAPSLPPSSSGMTQPNSAPVQFSGVRPGQNTPISVSQPHPRISSVSSISSPATPIAPPIHLDIVLTPVGEIVTMLAAKLQSLITANDRLKAASKATTDAYVPPPSQSKSDPRLLSFHARNIPSITITAYLTRILKYCPTDPEVFISVLVYFDRIMRIANRHAQPLFGAYYSSYNVLPSGPPLVHSPLPGPTHDDDSFAIDSFNVHRLVITTVAVATKFFSDQFYTNSRYARVPLRVPPPLPRSYFWCEIGLIFFVGRGITIGRTESFGNPVFDSVGFQFNDSSCGNTILCRSSSSFLDRGTTTTRRQSVLGNRHFSTAPTVDGHQIANYSHDPCGFLCAPNSVIGVCCHICVPATTFPRTHSCINGTSAQFGVHGRCTA